MDHAEALHIKAAEKYLLGELSGELREAYEEHYFQCVECALDLKAGVTFVEASRAIAREEGLAGLAPARGERASSGWLAWLRPAIAAPAFAVLLAIVAYQNVVFIPRLKDSVAHSRAPQAMRSFSLIAQNSRGGAEQTIRVGPDESYNLLLDIPPDPPFSQYRCEFQSASGTAEWAVTVSAEMARKTVEVWVPGGALRPGVHTIVIRGQSDAGTRAGARDVIARIPFALEFSR